ncbi:hypothetical protein MANES_15G072500v8 [Manihot esculenta]|uniref:Uncharacterized protein n=3 Tax=Manihot esculenta TaxID=3983 RepID=A0ACB7G9X4_MANES|nr:hypothetical protein MANES_15G072500v8 [Manihot esculenta]KAG8637042.1 hypothetical protein MANES_15G072500v8 [Manihot esculenta]OAY28511.1 hypothetical protein MANES_15G072500v8 [Manihot esculenta]
MSEANQGNHPDISAIIPMKRKRGRPRVNGNQPCQVDRANFASDAMVGQIVHGVIEAAFDAGYLLSVRVSNSETTLRGVVFKPGRFVPVSTDNDVAPGVQMIRRNEIPLPQENYAQVHTPRSRERNGTVHTAQPVTSKGKQVPSIASQTPVISRGNVVPVVLQPVDLSNGNASEPSSIATQPADAVASKGKQVLDAAHPLNGSTPTNQVQAVENQLLHFQSQDKYQSMPSGTQKEPGVNQNLAQAQQEAEAQSMKLPEDDVDDTNQPLSVEPLQSVQPVLHNHPAVVSRTLDNYRTGKMTELLQVLQENMTENQTTSMQDETNDARLGSLETELGDEDTDNSKKCA